LTAPPPLFPPELEFPFFVGVDTAGVERVASDSLGRFRFLSPPFAGEEEETENGLEEVGAEVTTAEPGARDEENNDMIAVCYFLSGVGVCKR
jgi:hypothetical protein